MTRPLPRLVSVSPGFTPATRGRGQTEPVLPGQGLAHAAIPAPEPATAAITIRAFHALIDRTLTGGDFGLWAARDLLDQLIRAGLARIEGAPDTAQALHLCGTTGTPSTGGAYALLVNWQTSAMTRLAQP